MTDFNESFSEVLCCGLEKAVGVPPLDISQIVDASEASGVGFLISYPAAESLNVSE